MYSKDDGPLTLEQLEIIKKESSATNTPNSSFTQSLSPFNQKSLSENTTNN